MNWVDSFYKTKHLATHGVFICLAVLVLFLLGLFIPDLAPAHYKSQIATLNGFSTKHDDAREVSDFILSIKDNEGFLVMGTSETTSLDQGNYYDFLNRDKTIKGTQFSVLAGAGRTCGLYIPLFLKHRKEIKGMKLIYFINPVYWRTDLSTVDLEYWNRYINYSVTKQVELSKKELDRYYQPILIYQNKMNLFRKTVENMEQTIRSLRRAYFHKLRYQLNPKAYANQFNFMMDRHLNDYSSYSLDTNAYLENTDTYYNVLKSFEHKEWFRPIDDTATYRYQELESFIQVCQDLGIEATFVLGPINQQFIEKYSPASLTGYLNTVDSIRSILKAKQASFIDASDISSVSGAFTDHQHHSSYGGFLIYKKIKAHFYE
jgi:GR25 family glycosyltransferase involved in LPS biosynthesis